MTTYKKTGSILAGSHLSGTATVATAIALVVAGARMMVSPRGLEPPHYHSDQHHYGDMLVGVLAVTIGAAALRSFTFKRKL